MIPQLTRDQILAVWAQRFRGSPLSDQEITDRFDELWALGHIDVSLDADGQPCVTMCERRSRQ
jgi:hypothetical protein